MGLFGSSPKISSKDFKKSLKEVKNLSPQERAYVEGRFKKDIIRKGGLSEYDFKKGMRDLKRDHSDSIDSYERKKLGEKLEEHFKK